MGHAASSRSQSIRELRRRRATPGRTASGSSTARSDSGAGAMTSERERFRRPGSSWTWKPGYATWTSCASTCRSSTPPCSSTPEIDVALCKSYNRWIAKATEKSRGRLRWVAVLPLLNIDKAVEEVRWAKDHGACGVFKKGIECGDRAASDPYFFPVYDQASRLDLPICIHTAMGNIESATAEGSGLGGGMVAIAAFSALAEHGIPDMFPNLRVGFIETGASWVPYLYADLVAKKLRRTFLPIDFKEDLFRRNRFYVACQTNDDLPYILKYGTEDSLMIGTDYSHADQSAEIQALDVIEQRAEKGEIPASVARKILDDNPRRFYGI